ncbi:MAG: SRPBCC domain-containing protein [Paracoccaceae bacterium]
MTAPIVKTITVACNAAQAFEIFVARISVWWPLDRHAASAAAGKAALAVTIEPQVGGKVYETMWDGAIDHWGEVLAYEPPRHFAMTWHPGNNKDHPTRVAVLFEDMPDGGCRVTLTHSGWEAWADRADAMRENYNNGWDAVLARFIAAAGRD